MLIACFEHISMPIDESITYPDLISEFNSRTLLRIALFSCSWIELSLLIYLLLISTILASCHAVFVTYIRHQPGSLDL